MANMHAAIGLAQLQKMERISTTRREVCCYYNSRLGATPFVRSPQKNISDITPFLYYIRVPETERDGLRHHLSMRGIDTGIHWQPGHWFTLFKNCRRGSLQVTRRVGRQILSLPLSSDMTIDTAEIVAEAVTSYFEKP
jgi:dTDP-4-amino-4,6-dideoxygalactose transaminase